MQILCIILFAAWPGQAHKPLSPAHLDYLISRPSPCRPL